MNRTRSIAALVAATLALTAVAQTPPGQAPGGGIQRETSFPSIASGKWTGKRLADGQPDVQGHWSNTIANHNNWTDPQGGVPTDPNKLAVASGPREARAPSRVSDPPDGQLPYQPWARAKQQDFLQNFHDPSKPEHIEPLARCAPAGVPKSFTWHGYEIRQYPGQILFLFNSGYRLIYLDGRPHLPDDLELWNADSRGHWEGNTLVVNVTNNNGKALLARTGDFISAGAKITERFIFDNDGRRYNYVAVIDDPKTFTRPWTATIPAIRWTEKDTANGWHYEAHPANAPGRPRIDEREERICAENNGGFGLMGTPVEQAPEPATEGDRP